MPGYGGAAWERGSGAAGGRVEALKRRSVEAGRASGESVSAFEHGTRKEMEPQMNGDERGPLRYGISQRRKDRQGLMTFSFLLSSLRPWRLGERNISVHPELGISRRRKEPRKNEVENE